MEKITHKLRGRSFIRGRMPEWLKITEERLKHYAYPLDTLEDWLQFQRVAQTEVMRHSKGKSLLDARLAPEGFTLLILRNGLPILSIDKL